MIKKVVLAYSGGLDTSVMIKWLKENYKCDVVACYVDIGQGEDTREIKNTAVKSGAGRVYIVDAKYEFINDYIFPALKAEATYEGRYFLATALARPLIAKKVVEVAKKENADAVAHGATGKGNDQVRFELAFKYLAPDLKIIAPWREWDLKSREDELKYAMKHKIPIGDKKTKRFSVDANIWHTSYEGGDLEDIEVSRKTPYFNVIPPEKAPDKATFVEVNFKEGIPQKLNGKKYKPYELIRKLNEIGIKNSIGVIDMVENRVTGIKSRAIYECPAATILYFAHRELESITLDRETLHFKSLIAQKYGELVYYGLWFSPLRKALDAFINEVERYVTGSIKLKLYKGNIFVCWRNSKYSLYRKEYATFEREKVFDQKDATGFINIFGLPLKIVSKIRKEV